MNSKIIVNIDDIKKTVYFISNLTQMQGTRPMQGTLSPIKKINLKEE